MILKILKGVWFFSLLLLFVVFFYIYAALPEVVNLTDVEGRLSVSRNGFFYSAIVLFALINVLVFVVNRILSSGDQGFSSWIYGLVVSFNIFFFTSLGFLHVLNGGDRYDFSQMGPAVYGSLILICIWIISWPVILIYRKIISN